MNQQQLEQKALTNEENKLLDKAFAYAAERGKGEKPETFTDSQIKVLHAFIDGASWMQGEGERQWISVKDRLPEEGGRYWCYVRELTDLGYSHFQWNCAYNAKEKRFSDSTLTNGENVTHWMPLPPKPQTEHE